MGPHQAFTPGKNKKEIRRTKQTTSIGSEQANENGIRWKQTEMNIRVKRTALT